MKAWIKEGGNGENYEILRRKTEKIPVIAEVDVLVVGSGPAGICAAISCKENIDVRDVDARQIQEIIIRGGVKLCIILRLQRNLQAEMYA